MELYESDLFGLSTLKAYYRFESGALTTDSSGNGHTLTAISDPAETSGKFGGGVALDSNDAYSHADNADLKPTGTFTIGAWIKTTQSSVGVIQSRFSTSVVAGIYLRIASNGKVGLTSGRNTGNVVGTDYQSCGSTTVVTDGNWHLLVGTWDGGYLRIYIDGVLEGSIGWVYAPVYNGTNYFRIGCENFSGTNAYFIGGSMDDVFLFNGKALSLDEIEILYNRHIEMFSLDLAVQANAFDYFKMILDVTDGLIEVLPLNLEVVAQMIDSFKMLLEVALNNFEDFKMLLEVTDGTVFDNFAMLLDVVDGTVFDNFKMDLSVISATPAFRSVTAHRLTPVLHEVV